MISCKYNKHQNAGKSVRSVDVGARMAGSRFSETPRIDRLVFSHTAVSGVSTE